jgi:hypothetical protein
VLSNNQFGSLLGTRLNDPYWQRVDVIQTCIKAKYGLGDLTIVNFFAPINEQKPMDEIDFDYKQMPSDYDLVMADDDQQYCQKLCMKMCYYIQKVRGYEVL